MGYTRTVEVVALYATSMGYIEAVVVVYLRALYYPGGFRFPLTTFPEATAAVEVAREAATLIMLAAIGTLAGKQLWERFGWFIIAFGVWDIAYYVWLKVLLDWPASLFEPDILFLIPLPWIGPVIAPVLISIIMIGVGYAITLRFRKGKEFRPNAAGWVLAAFATAVILSSFLSGNSAVNGFFPTKPYPYALLFAGLGLYVLAYLASSRKSG